MFPSGHHALAGVRDLGSKEVIRGPKEISFGEVMVTHWEDNRESGREAAGLYKCQHEKKQERLFKRL